MIFISQYRHRKVAAARLQNSQSCVYCGINENLTLDHLIPKHKGGTDDIRNIVVACGKCNNLKLHYTIPQLRDRNQHAIADVVQRILSARQTLTDTEIEHRITTPLSNESPKDTYNRMETFLAPCPLGKRIETLMNERYISKTRLRTLAGVAGWTVDRVISGEVRPQPRTLKKIADVFNVDVIDAFGDLIPFKATQPHTLDLEKTIWQHGLTCRRLALATGLYQNFFRDIIVSNSHKRPGSYAIKKLQSLFNVDADKISYWFPKHYTSVDGHKRTIGVQSVFKATNDPILMEIAEHMKNINLTVTDLAKGLGVTRHTALYSLRKRFLPTQYIIKKYTSLFQTDAKQIRRWFDQPKQIRKAWEYPPGHRFKPTAKWTQPTDDLKKAEILEHMRSINLTPHAFADRLGCHFINTANIIHARNQRTEIGYRKLAAALELPLERIKYLFDVPKSRKFIAKWERDNDSV